MTKRKLRDEMWATYEQLAQALFENPRHPVRRRPLASNRPNGNRGDHGLCRMAANPEPNTWNGSLDSDRRVRNRTRYHLGQALPMKSQCPRQRAPTTRRPAGQSDLADAVRPLPNESVRAHFAGGSVFLSAFKAIAKELEKVHELRLLIGNTSYPC